MQVIYSISLSQFVEDTKEDSPALEHFRSVCNFRNEIFSLFIPLPGASLQSRSTLNRLCANLGNKVRNPILKFFEMVIVQQSNIPPISSESTDQCPTSTVLTCSKQSYLFSEAKMFLTSLQNMVLKPDREEEFPFVLTGPFLASLLDSFASIAKQCPPFFGEIVKFFENIQQMLPFIMNRAQLKSLDTRMKSILLTLLFHSEGTTSSYRNRIEDILHRLGATRFEITYGISFPDCRSTFVTLGESDVKRYDLDTSTSSERCESTSLLDEITYHIIPKLTLPNVVDLLILSMVNLPSELPSNFRSSIPFGDPKVHIRPLANYLASQLVSWSKSGVPSNQTLFNQFINTNSPKQNAFNAEKLVKPIPSYRRCAYKRNALKRILAFNPILSYPKVFSKCPALDIKNGFRTKLILRLALGTPKLSDLHKLPLEKAMSKPEENFDLLMSLLTQEYSNLNNFAETGSCPEPMDASDGGKGETKKSSLTSIGSNLNSYEVLFNRILHRIAEPSIKKPYLNRFFLESPSYPPDVVSFFKKYCSVPEQAEYGFEIMRILIEIKSSQWRENLLKLLFAFSAFEEPTVRNAAIKAAWKLADSSLHFEKVVEHHAVGLMKKLLQPKPTGEMFSDLYMQLPTLSDKWTTEICKPCSHFFFGILPRKQGSLIPLLAEVYLSANETVQTFILQNMDDAICQISLLSPHILFLLKHCPPGAESLVVRILHALTDPKKVTPERPNVQIMPPRPVVESMIRLCRECGNDARFIIPGIVGLNKMELTEFIPRLFQLGDTFVKLAISRILKASFGTQPPPDPRNPGFGCQSPSENDNAELLAPADLLVAIHLLEFVKIPNANGQTAQKSVTNVDPASIQQAIKYCLKQRQVFTPKRLVEVINRILSHPTLPKVLVFTLLQALDLHPILSEFTLEFLLKMIKRQVWNTKQLWDGFIQICLKIKQKSYEALLKLPSKHLRDAFEKSPELFTTIRRFVEKFPPASRSRVPGAVLKALQLEVNS
nr:protocadherin 11 [Hymenolepis microstoma]